MRIAESKIFRALSAMKASNTTEEWDNDERCGLLKAVYLTPAKHFFRTGNKLHGVVFSVSE
jgi:hypothetical protein